MRSDLYYLPYYLTRRITTIEKEINTLNYLHVNDFIFFYQ